MKIKITEPYLWLPVDAKEEKVLLHLYSEGEKIDEIAIRLGVTDCDYYAYKDVSAYKNKELEIIRYDEGNLDRIFQYPEKPQTVYPFRPKLHYHMAAGWCNDPCGLVYADGIYHLYHQCNPYGPEWENMHWGHAVSNDLIHWERKGLALCPDENGTAYTGSAIVDKKNLLGHGKDALLFYHTAAGGKNEWSRTTGKQFNFTQRLYYSTDGGETLVRDDRFLMEQIAPLNRDPRVFYHEESNGYSMLLYLDKSDYAIFRSEDLLNWRETQRLSFPGMWECPELFELPVEGNENEKKWIFWSVEGYYVVGTFDVHDRIASAAGIRDIHIPRGTTILECGKPGDSYLLGVDKERKRKLPRHDVGSVRTQPAKKQRPLSGRIPKCAGTVRTFGENHGTSPGNDNSEASV